MRSARELTSPVNSALVNVASRDDLIFWTKRFQVNAAMLTKVVQIVGPRPKDVAKFLYQLKHV